MSRGVKISLGLVVVAIIGVVAMKMKGGSDKPVEVRLEEVATRDLVSAVTASGKIEAKSQVDVSSEVTARILRITVKEGDLVTKGQLLVELDQVQFKGAVDRATASLTSVQAQLLQAKTNRDQAKRALDRNRELKRTNPTLIADEVMEQSQQAFDVSEALLKSSQAQVQQTQASLKEAQDNLARTRLFAPISGRVVRLAVEEGEVAQTGAFSRDVGLLMRIADLSVIQAVVKVDETDVIRLELGDSVSVAIDAFPDTAFVGKVTKIANSAATTAAGAASADRAVDFEVEVTLTNPPADVRPDLSMTARIVTDVRKGALSIPIIALTTRPDSAMGGDQAAAAGAPLTTTSDTAGGKKPKDKEGVFIVENGVARFRTVKVGIAGDEHFEVLTGLKKGETIVAGSYQAIRDLKDSSKVKAAPAGGPAVVKP
ncbi:MAG: efflux RND transporter periplasmic adaptor subunit [Gemmatimonadetes bacterium]|jgi:HlyD family secretion protein|nr:efflux RND transporter periplasmic adaptor subunit [Gemmatimonadota bacterium]MBP6443697.1 efflux RND transporter periplasmic adaptor subunit [Gemmatimonadales bacterium]MBK9550489.1 efflux RND transporter periplasmic adaptor subunit [Gemmatimonadota bacterium]MBP6571368.1 efflux RND transporter periplasmic adaptor subunit [Gemmatimonadales bacterium]MBP7620449.1 efflux RND transporter periplasmic adaptor subunit [Gemmatimonadales bacterium]